MTTSDVETRWVRVCATDDVEDDEGLQIECTPPISVFKSEGEIFCIDDTCTHDPYSLAEGWVEDCVVECALHQAKFDLRTGSQTPPAAAPITVHEVRVDGDDVQVKLPAGYALAEEG